MEPGSKDPDFLKATSRAVFDGMAVADPNATWLMQGWLFQGSFRDNNVF
jgi:alpha-N-acetylglucosaminidase